MKATKNTSVQFGLVSVPVGVCKATEDNKVSLRMASPAGKPVTQQYTDGDWSGSQADCQKGVFADDGEFRPVDFAEIDPELPESLEVIDAIPLTDVPFACVTGRHFLQSPAKNGNPKGYRLVAEALRTSKRAAVTEFAARSVTQPAVIFEENGVLVMCTMTYAADRRKPDDAVLAPSKVAISKAEIELANKLLDVVSGSSALETLENKALPKQQELIAAALAKKPRAKKAGAKKAETPSGDLMAQLAASLNVGTEKVAV